MILETGDMWSVFGKGDLWLFTGNSYITKKDELVMGCGLALEVKTRYPDVPGLLVEAIHQPRFRDGFEIGMAWSIYGLAVIPFEPANGRVGVFQVKHHFRDKALLSLIGHSVLKLIEAIRIRELERVDLNFPGIGYGGLYRAHVLPIISELPDSVHIWERS